ncbi:unnamed protein product [Caretta caretta]
MEDQRTTTISCSSEAPHDDKTAPDSVQVGGTHRSETGSTPQCYINCLVDITCSEIKNNKKKEIRKH